MAEASDVAGDVFSAEACSCRIPALHLLGAEGDQLLADDFHTGCPRGRCRDIPTFLLIHRSAIGRLTALSRISGSVVVPVLRGCEGLQAAPVAILQLNAARLRGGRPGILLRQIQLMFLGGSRRCGREARCRLWCKVDIVHISYCLDNFLDAAERNLSLYQGKREGQTQPQLRNTG